MNFQQPSAFWLLLFLLVPIIIHLFQFRRYKKLLFSNVSFLKEVTETKRKKSTLKHLLILFFRMLLIAALVFCWANPNWPNENQVESPQLVILDNTPSMLTIAEGDDLPVMEEMLQHINQLSEEYTNFNPQLVDASGQNFSLYEQPGISSSQTEINLSGILAAKGGSTIFLASDFQRSFIKDNASIFNDTSYNFVLLPAYRNLPETMVWDSLWLESSGSLAAKQLKIQLVKRNGSALSSINAIMEQQTVGANTVDFAKARKQTTTISLPETQLSYNQLTLQTEDLTYFDNVFYSVYLQDSLLKVLYLHNKESNPLVFNVFSAPDQFDLEVKEAANFSFQTLSKYDVVMVEMDNDFNTVKAERLQQFVANGGRLILIPEVDFNQINSLKKLGFSDARSIAQQNNVLPLETPDYDNPFFEGVFQERKKQLDMAKVKLSYVVNSGTPLLTTVDGRQFLSQIKNAGNVYLFSGSLLEGEKPFMKSPLFLPVFYRMALSDQDQGQIVYHYLDEEVLNLNYLGVPPNALVKLVKGEQTFIPDQRMSAGGMQIILPKNELSPGFWQVVDSKNSVPYGAIALNYSKAESMASYYTINELKALFSQQRNVTVLDNLSFDQLSAYMDETKSDIPLWKYFLILALLSLFAEVFIIRFIK